MERGDRGTLQWRKLTHTSSARINIIIIEFIKKQLFPTYFLYFFFLFNWLLSWYLPFLSSPYWDVIYLYLVLICLQVNSKAIALKFFVFSQNMFCFNLLPLKYFLFSFLIFLTSKLFRRKWFSFQTFQFVKFTFCYVFLI